VPVKVRVERIGKHDKLVVRIARDPQHPEELASALNKVFAVGFDDAFADAAPDYWQQWLRRDLHPDAPKGAFAAGKGDVEMKAPGVTPPRLTFDPDPTFSAAARQRKFQGVEVVGLTVDSHGEPHDVHVVRPLGMGLDELAVQTVRRYKFAPAIYNGRMVAVEINIEVNFRIY
jgi:TonB family protein